MAVTLEIGVKYCGGCNPEYDRVALVEEMQKHLKGKVSFGFSGIYDVDLILVVHGCDTRCADLSPFQKMEIFEISSVKERERFIREMADNASKVG